MDDVDPGRQRGQVRAVLHQAGGRGRTARPGQRSGGRADGVIKGRVAGAFGEGKQGRHRFGHHAERHDRRVLARGISGVKRPGPEHPELVGTVAVVEPDRLGIGGQKIEIGRLVVLVIEVGQVAGENPFEFGNVGAAAVAGFLQHPLGARSGWLWPRSRWSRRPPDSWCRR